MGDAAAFASPCLLYGVFFNSFVISAMAKAKKASGSGSKKVKDPNAPKRAMSAFFFWMQENRERLKKPGMGVADVAKAAGVEWAKLADKSKWEKKAAEDKKRYERDLAAYKKE
uniref:HMG box domain-containing protein n=3 Tax=Ascarididae TaxID=6250 RepID=A0A915ATE8_PARUN